MRFRDRRTLLAALLTTAAVVVPCTAWYVAGSRTAAREATAIRERPSEMGGQLARALAARLAGRLEAIRESEGRRPHYHYQDNYHDPTSSCQCASITPSPLATGITDPLIETHFEIDPYRDVTLPALHSEEWPQQVTRAWFDDQHSLLSKLQGAAPQCMAAADVPPAMPPVRGGILELPGREDFHVEPNDPALEMGPFEWFTLPIGDEPTLVSLRRVESSVGAWVQGFLISRPAVTQWLATSDYPVDFRPDEPGTKAGVVASSVELPGAPWCVTLDVSESAEEAEIRAASVMGSFRRSFAMGSVAAVLAGLAVVVLLWQTERLARQRSRFAASAAHELRTPLASLRLYGDMLAGDLGDPAKSREYARRIAEESERLGRVVTNVLGYTGLERDSVQVQPTVGDIGGAVRECVARLEPTLAATGATIDLRIPDDLPAARFDREALVHVVQNLVDNAEKYSREAADRTITVELVPTDEHVELRVANRGPGVDPALRGRLFHPFVRGDGRDAPAGLGLGLSLVQALVKAQHGTIRCTERPGGGSVFTATVPRPS